MSFFINLFTLADIIHCWSLYKPVSIGIIRNNNNCKLNLDKPVHHGQKLVSSISALHWPCCAADSFTFTSGSYRKKKRGRARETRKRAGGRLGIRMRTTQGRASRRRHGQAAGWRAARGPTANGVREREKERVERKNDSTKLSSILTAQNLKFHIETRKIPRMKVVQNLISSDFCFRQNFIWSSNHGLKFEILKPKH